MIKTVLFGAGPGALQFIENTKQHRIFLAFFDNDENKHGTQYGGLNVLPPSQIQQCDYDEVVITTQWAMDVEKQLIEEIGVSSDKVKIPEKGKLKKITPFLQPGTAQLGRDIIIQLSILAYAAHIPLVIDFGTLLGIVRDGDLIPWDDDIDFSVPEAYADATEKMLIGFCQSGLGGHQWHTERVEKADGSVLGFLLKFRKKSANFTEFTTSICLRRNVDGQSLHLPSLGMWCAPREHFDANQCIQWNRHSILAPYQYEDYLTFQYGDWKTPLKNMQLSDYSNLNQVSFDDVKNAKISAKVVD